MEEEDLLTSWTYYQIFCPQREITSPAFSIFSGLGNIKYSPGEIAFTRSAFSVSSSFPLVEISKGFRSSGNCLKLPLSGILFPSRKFMSTKFCWSKDSEKRKDGFYFFIIVRSHKKLTWGCLDSGRTMFHQRGKKELFKHKASKIDCKMKVC